MEAIRYIVDTLLWLLTLAFLLRFLFQLVRADFRDPMADAIVRVTNWLILPLRRLLPPIGKIDTATVVAVIAIASARTAALLAFGPFGILLVALLDSFVVPLPAGVDLLVLTIAVAYGGQLCEPVLRPVRRVIPKIGQIDFSVLWVSIAIGALLILLR